MYIQVKYTYTEQINGGLAICKIELNYFSGDEANQMRRYLQIQVRQCHACSDEARERSRQAEAATARAANNVGKKKSKVDLAITVCSGKHTASLGKSNGSLRKPPPQGDNADAKAIPGANDTRTTVTIKRSVHAAAWRNCEGCWKIEWKGKRYMRKRKYIYIYG